MNHYRKFIVNLVLLICITIILDLILGKILGNLYLNIKSGEKYQTTYALDKTNAEIIILGSSRANHHYIPKIIEDSLKMSCYNAGRDGKYLLYSYAVFKSITKRYSPKLVILEFDPSELNFVKLGYERLSPLLPYYYKKEIQEILELRSKYEKWKLLSAVYRYNSLFPTIIYRNIKSGENITDGYIPLFGTNITTKDLSSNHYKNVLQYDQNIFNALDSMGSICSKRNIKFIIIQSPKLEKENQENEIKLVKAINEKYQTTFWDFSNDSIFLNQHFLFKDRNHLNDNGANVFTQLVIERLKTE